jgi:AcrR family transcriptional regulator
VRQLDLRTRLLRAAEQEIAACGPSRASLRAIARRVGVSHQATAHHFEDRAGLFTALALEGTLLLSEETEAAIAAAPVEGGLQVAAAGTAYVRFALRHPTMFDVMYRPELLHAEDPDLVEASLRQRQLMTDAIVRAQATGWGASLPAPELALLGWATVHGLAVLQRGGHAASLYPDVDPDEILGRVVHALDALAG